MFHIQDPVLYGADGICIITDKTTLSFGKDKKEYWLLSPVHQDRSVIYVPTDNPTLLAKMHPVITADAIEAMLTAIAADPCLPWNADDVRRREQWRTILTSGDRRELLRMIKTIYLHGVEQRTNGRKLHHADETAMKDAEALLYGEFSYVLKIPPEEVLPYIVTRLEA